MAPGCCEHHQSTPGPACCRPQFAPPAFPCCHRLPQTGQQPRPSSSSVLLMTLIVTFSISSSPLSPSSVPSSQTARLTTLTRSRAGLPRSPTISKPSGACTRIRPLVTSTYIICGSSRAAGDSLCLPATLRGMLATVPLIVLAVYYRQLVPDLAGPGLPSLFPIPWAALVRWRSDTHC